MKAGLTEVIFLLDCSGSMYGLETDTIAGFNTMIRDQKANHDECLISTILFNHKQQVLHDRIAINEISELTEGSYRVSGSTALLDAMGDTIRHVQSIHESLCEYDLPERTLFVITTDGMENSSHRFCYPDILKMVNQQKTDANWEFLFLGANIDAISTARDIGIDSDHAASFINDSCGIATNYDAISAAICEYRSRKSLKTSWKQRIDGDYNRRKTS